MPQETKKAPENNAPSATLQGLVATRQDEDALLNALEEAFDYRGDVTITTTAADEITGYIFDRRRGATLAGSSVRLLTATSDDPAVIRFDQIATLTFSGKDTARGKSFETWVKKYVEKKRAGLPASIDSDTPHE